MDPIVLYFVGGLGVGVVGSLVAARLLRVDRLWVLPDKPGPESLIEPIVQAAKVWRVTGRAGLIAFRGRTDHPLLVEAFGELIRGTSENKVRARLEAFVQRSRVIDGRCQFAGRLLGVLAPVLGIAGMAGAMYLGLSQLQDPTASASGLGVSVLLLMVGGNMVAMFSKRLSRGSPAATAAGAVSAAMVIEAAAMMLRKDSPELIEASLRRIAGERAERVSLARAA